MHDHLTSRMNILCVGDAILDRFTEGVVDRISPEAPIPVFRKALDRNMAGGGANVACNAAALGGNVLFCTAIGTDAAADELESLVERASGVEMAAVRVPGRQTPQKTRLVAAGQQLLRIDDETTDPLPAEAEVELLHNALKGLRDAEQLLICDYNKGILSDNFIRTVIAEARIMQRSVLVDSKRSDLRPFGGANIATPNLGELRRATGLSVDSIEEVEAAGLSLISTTGIQSLIVTRGADGLSLIKAGTDAQHIDGIVKEIFDVSGAGDTVLAALAVALGSGTRLDDAAHLANVAGSIAVTRRGTAVVSRSDLANELRHSDNTKREPKICDRAAAIERVALWRAAGLRIGFTNGCFDILHPGHIKLLEHARRSCDRLIVGLNTDISVRRIKGSSRPINSEVARATVLSAVEYVDAVTFFSEETPIGLVQDLLPDILVKGADYPLDGIVGGDLVLANGGKVLRVPLAPDQSTTSILDRLSGRTP